MAYQYKIVGRKGHMTEQVVERNADGDVVKVVKESEHVTDSFTVAATDPETGQSATGIGATEAEAKKAAGQNMTALHEEKARRREEALGG